MDIQNQQKLLLHVCCAPCSSYVLEYLYSKYNITTFFYNPNITIREEYEKRIGELKRFVREAPFAKNVVVLEGTYNPEKFIELSKNLENEPERGIRCYKCYELRLRETAIYALEHKYDLFTTTLSISPHKNAGWLNEIGMRLSDELGIDYLYSDFKKKNGYARSIQLSKEYGLYRQNYCGCVYSKNEADRRKNSL
ncbi:MAG: epoxyqueuosine reductase QueH [Clostridium sp.]|nr:epoxyqueuosine reductase QueH [Clostridium sp.]MCM1170620.1 epoxyqueuosine reductase QueH [Clostridium sp.]MCM1207327.1 epoxyqueuosine reductase QueH [Ruminococcus sp.]